MIKRLIEFAKTIKSNNQTNLEENFMLNLKTVSLVVLASVLVACNP